MGSITCTVRGCHNNWKKRRAFLQQVCFEHRPLTRSQCCGAPYDLHPPPKEQEAFRLWVKALNCRNPPKRPYVCSYHFVDRKPTKEHPFPEKFLGASAPPKKPRGVMARNSASNTPRTSMMSEATSVKETDRPYIDDAWEYISPSDHNYSLMSLEPTTCEWGIQLYKTLLRTEVLCQFHTGLPIHRFYSVAEYLLPHYNGSFRLHPLDQLLMTLMKLKLNPHRACLAQRFGVSRGDVGSILRHWIDTLEGNMTNCIQWLPREIIRETMPQCVRERYPGATCIVDCSETPLQKRRNSTSFSQHCSQNTTVKYVVAMAPCGLVMFISTVYGGRSSDRFVTADSGFLEYLRPGDEVMADGGLDIRDLLYKRKAKLTIPAFTQKGSRSSEEDGTCGRTVDVKAHVKSVVCRLKLFKIISQTVPTDLACKMDKILRICGALCNLRGHIVEGDQIRFY